MATTMQIKNTGRAKTAIYYFTDTLHSFRGVTHRRTLKRWNGFRGSTLDADVFLAQTSQLLRSPIVLDSLCRRYRYESIELFDGPECRQSPRARKDDDRRLVVLRG